MMSLVMAPKGAEVRVLKCFSDEKIKRHLENLGIIAGAKITPVLDNNGDLIVKVKDCRLALNKGVAEKIFVRL